MNPLLHIENLSLVFNTFDGDFQALKKINIDLAKGDSVGVVGETGSGKSVTAKAIMGLLPAPPARITNGKILFEDRDILLSSEREMRQMRGNDIAIIFQDPMTYLNPVLKVGTQLVDVLRAHDESENKQKKKITSNYSELRSYAVSTLGKVKLPNPELLFDYYPHQLSGGMRQRVLIAMALLGRPKLLIADEPTTALDVTVQAEIVKLLKELSDELNISFLFISHDLGLISSICRYVYVMYHGEVVEHGPTDLVFNKPKHPYTKGLVSCRPSIIDNPKRLQTIDKGLINDEYKKQDRESSNKKYITQISPRNLKSNQKQLIETKGNERFASKVLSVNNLNKTFAVKSTDGQLLHNKALQQVSFDLEKGKSLGIVGESGSGKSTLLKIILKLLDYESGRVSFEGQDLSTLTGKSIKTFRKRVQPVFQDPHSSLNPRMTLLRSIAEPLKLHTTLRGYSLQQRVIELLDSVDLPSSFLYRYPHELSGGQKQRVCVARAIALNPSLLILDEPTSALDVSVQAQVLNLLKDLQEVFNFTLVMVTHDLPVVSFMCDELIVMKNGRIVEAGTTDNVVSRPSQEYTKILIDSVI
tara:strand:+ start:2477 stop:4234 length:1758 start_codon:yes stop_codon:yes gene_type:complete